jgi:hypothetical protein
VVVIELINSRNKIQNMKKPILLLSLILALGINTLAQNLTTDFVVIDPYCPNAEQIKAQYQGQSNTYIVVVSKVMAPEQIATVLTGKKVTDLHLFVSTKPGTLGFGNIALNPETIQDQAASLAKWKFSVAGKVVIHSTDVFTSERGLAFKASLEQITGLIFIMQ